MSHILKGFAALATTLTLAVPATALAAGAATIVAHRADAEFAFRNSVAFVRGHIGSSGPLWFLIDTGASRSALDRTVARNLALEPMSPTQVEGTGGTIEVESVRLPELRLAGNIVVRALEPTAYDLGGSLAPEGATIAGILGYDVLKDLMLIIEPGSGRVRMETDPLALDLSGARILRFELDNGIPAVEAFINSVPVRLRIDTGASIGPGPTTFVNVTTSFFDQLRAAEPSLQPYTYFSATGTGGDVRIPVVRGQSLVLGGLNIPAPSLIVQSPVGYFARSDAVGFLGIYSLQSLSRIVVDYPRQRLILYH
ncbi:MAG: pepsin/retropepsin-like aspartic protease family protein [Allosphingosinicella sp.]